MNYVPLWINHQDRVSACLNQPAHQREALVLLAHELLDVSVADDDGGLTGENLEEAQVAFTEAVGPDGSCAENADQSAVSQKRRRHCRLGCLSRSGPRIFADVGNEDRAKVARHPPGDAGICRL
jgi:hypothetical protein